MHWKSREMWWILADLVASVWKWCNWNLVLRIIRLLRFLFKTSLLGGLMKQYFTCYNVCNTYENFVLYVWRINVTEVCFNWLNAKPQSLGHVDGSYRGGEAPRWRIGVSAGNRSKLPETPPLCLQMDCQLVNGKCRKFFSKLFTYRRDISLKNIYIFQPEIFNILRETRQTIKPLNVLCLWSPEFCSVLRLHCLGLPVATE